MKMHTLQLWAPFLLLGGRCGSLLLVELHTHGIESLRVTADGRWLVMGGGDSSVLIWELDGGYELS